MFYHVPPAPVEAEVENGLLLNLDVPVLNEAGAGWVSMATMAVVLAGFTWVVWKLVGGGGAVKDVKKEAKKKE